jgi:hypothetical protein
LRLHLLGVADLKYELAFLAKRNNDTLRLCATVASSRETRPRHWQAESVKQKNHYSDFDSATPSIGLNPKILDAAQLLYLTNLQSAVSLGVHKYRI